MIRQLMSVAIVAAGLAACSDKPEKVWIVVDLVDPAGKPVQMSFDNPSIPDMTLAECQDALGTATPTLMQGIASKPEAKGSRFVASKCVQSAVDPIKPKV